MQTNEGYFSSKPWLQFISQSSSSFHLMVVKVASNNRIQYKTKRYNYCHGQKSFLFLLHLQKLNGVTFSGYSLAGAKSLLKLRGMSPSAGRHVSENPSKGLLIVRNRPLQFMLFLPQVKEDFVH